MPTRADLVRPLALLLTLAPALLVGACADPEPIDQATLDPVAVGAEIVVADTLARELVVMATDDGRVTGIRRVGVIGTPTLLAALPDQSAVLSLATDTESLTHVSLPEVAATTFVLGAPFTALAISPDSNAALAYFAPGSATQVFNNGNELAFIDLHAATPPELAVSRRTLPSLGGTPTAVHVSPVVADTRYAFVLSTNHVAVLDLLRPDTRERSVPLVSLDSAATRTPNAVAFGVTPDGSTLWGVVTTAESNAAYALEVSVNAAPQASEAPFNVVLTQLPGFAPGGDAALLALPDQRLVALMTDPAQGTLTMVELSTGADRSLSLGAGVNAIATYVEDGRPIAIVHRVGGTNFDIVDVAAIEEKKDKAARKRHAKHGIQRLIPVPGTSLFVALHGGATDAVSVIHANTDRITPFGRTGVVQDVFLSSDASMLFLLTSLGSDDYLVSVDMASLHPETAAIPAGADDLLVLEASGTIAAASAGVPGGRLTLWPTGATVDSAAHEVLGFLFDKLLDRTAEEAAR